MMKKILLLSICLIGFSFAGVSQTERDSIQKEYEERILLTRIDGIYIPADIFDALEQLDQKTSESSKEKYKNASEDEIVKLMRYRLGFWMKQNWALSSGSRLSHSLREYLVQSPDEAVDFILIAWHRHLNGKDLELNELGNHFEQMRVEAFKKKQAKSKVLHSETRKLTKEEIEKLEENN